MRKCFLVMMAMLLLAVPVVAQDGITGNSTSYVRIAQFSVDAPQLDIYVNGEQILEAFDFPSVSDWIELEAGTYTMQIVRPGGALEDAIISADFDLSAGDWATLAIRGEVERDTLAIQALVDNLSNISDGMTEVSIFHAITDLEPVNVFVGDIELVRLLSYPGMLGESDGYVSDSIVAGAYGFDIQTGDGTSILDVDAITMGAGQAYFLAIVGTSANPQYVLVSTDVASILPDESTETVAIGEGQLLARVGHFSVSAGAVDIYLNGEVTMQDVQFGDVSTYMELEAGIYDVALVPTGGDVAEALYEGQIALPADSVTLISAIGFAEDGSLEVVTATEENTAPEANFSRIAFFQAIPSLEPFELLANDIARIQGASYPAFEGAGDGYASVDIVADNYEFVVEGAGNTLNVGNVTTGAGRVYLIVSAGLESSPLFLLISEEFPAEE